MADSNPKFNREAFKRALAHVESSGGKFLENSSSSAVGKYQFLWNNIKSDPSLKGVTKRQFIDSPELQENIMDLALNGKLKGYPNYIENSRKLKQKYGSSLRVDEIALLTHFLGSGGVQEQLKTGAYEVPGVNMSVDGYTGKYNKFLQEYGLEAREVEATGRNPQAYSGPVSDADLYAQQAASIGMENQPLAPQPQDNPLTERLVRPDLQAKLDAMNDLVQGNDNAEADALEDANSNYGPLPLREYREGMRAEQVSVPQPQNEPNPVAQSIDSSLEIGREAKSPSAFRIKNMLSPKETDYKGFQNLSRPTDNITESNDYSYGGYVKQNKYVEGGPTDPVKGKTSTTTTTGPTAIDTRITATTGANGLPSSTRTITSTTPGTTTMETPFTQAGNDAYAKLDQAGKDAQDKAWNEIQKKNNTNVSTEVEETTQLGMQPLGVNFSPAGLSTPTEAIQAVPVAPKRPPMYHVGGSNLHNMRFAGHENTMITSDPTIMPDESFTTSPGDISTTSPMSGRRNIAYRNQLTESQQDAAETKYGGGWHTPIPDDIGAEMMAREAEDDAEIQARALKTHYKSLERQDQIASNQAGKASERNAVAETNQAKLQARIDNKAQKDAESSAKRQAILDARNQNQNAGGGMIKRADGSYSKRGLWDNIRANRGSGKKATPEMLKQGRKINNAKAYGGSVETEDSENFVAFEGGGTHEQNSLGGIPQGTGSNGKMNTVEEGETKVTIKGEEYIFSERGKLDGTGFEGTKATNSYAMGGDPNYSSDGLTAVAGTGADAIAGAAGGAEGAAGGGGGMGIAGAAAGMVSMGLDMIPEKNQENHTGVEGIQMQKSEGLAAAKGAASGAQMGAVAGPWGMAAGAVIGGAVGYFGADAANKKARKENLGAYAQANPALQNQNYGGGYLKKKKKGGKVLNPSTKKGRVKAMLRK